MARGRFLNKSVATDEKVALLMQLGGPMACLFHHRIIAFLDVNGNVRADEFWLKANLFPRDSVASPEDCRIFSVHLAECDLAVFYEVGGMLYLHFKNFEKNQHGLRKDKERPEYPEYKQELGIPTEKIRNADGMLTGISLSLSQSLSQPDTTYPPDLPEPKSDEPPAWMSEILTSWNQMASELGYSKIEKLTADRRGKLVKRKKETNFNFPEIIAAFRKNRPLIQAGKNGQEWRPDFDFVIRSEQTYTKILEGAYKSNGTRNTQRAGNLTPSGADW